MSLPWKKTDAIKNFHQELSKNTSNQTNAKFGTQIFSQSRYIVSLVFNHILQFLFELISCFQSSEARNLGGFGRIPEPILCSGFF
jgi:hypothetical protein